MPWIYNNTEIIININILLTDLNQVHCGDWAEEEDCPDSPNNFIAII